jgi:hypothetical protein
LYKYELDEPDSAYHQYVILCNDSTIGAEIKPKSLCAAAFIARDDLKDTVRADSLFKYIIITFPATNFAKISQEQLHVPVTIKTRADSAQNAYVKAENLFFNEDKTTDAIKAYFGVYKNYPELPIAPKSLFLAAWLSDEYLQKNKTAKKLYEKICEKYPKSIYCINEAQPRLKIVTDTLKALEDRKQRLEAKKAENSIKIQKQEKGQNVVSKVPADSANVTAADSGVVNKPLADDEPLSDEELGADNVDDSKNLTPVEDGSDRGRRPSK